MIYCPKVQGIPKKEIPSGSDTGMDKAVLLLEDGTFFAGSAFGRTGTSAGEVVFNTAMTGYQETLTDPSYNGQIVAMMGFNRRQRGVRGRGRFIHHDDIAAEQRQG